jgi:carboxymethylenebutenolidase
MDCQHDGSSNSELGAAVPLLHGGQPTTEVEKIKNAASLIHHAGLDSRKNEGWPALKTYIEKKQYSAQHFS